MITEFLHYPAHATVQDVVDDIRFVETGPGDWPVETILIESVEVH